MAEHARKDAPASKAGAVGAAAFVPEDAALSDLAVAVQRCRGCDLYAHATQAVFGAGPRRPELVLVGEQPGHEEDLAGLPFVGPSGRLLDRALREAGIDRSRTYVTNAVKHFKWTPRGKRRLHQRPNASEIHACKPWLDAELERLRPWVVVCLGAVAAQALLGRDFRVTRDRGRAFQGERGAQVLATVHPSSILRSRSAEEREQAFTAFCADLRVAKGLIGAG